MTHYNPQKKQRNRAILAVIVVIAIISYIAFSTQFERENPTITIDSNGYWNLSDPLHITISDNNKIKNYKVSIKTKEGEVVLSEQMELNKDRVELKLEHPQAKQIADQDAVLNIEAIDYSLWNMGNKATKTATITIDKKPPHITVVGHSFSIANGGAALVVFEAHDTHLNNLEIVTKNGRSFKPSRFYKDGFYASLIARDSIDNDFVAYVVATDKANNASRKRIPLYYNNKKFRLSKINLTQKFLDGKITELYEKYNKKNIDTNASSIDKFLFVNEVLRDASNELISTYSKNSTESLSSFNIVPFHPLPNSAVVATFGDKREFISDNKKISQSFHLGLDFASVREDKILATNSGKVAFVGDNGIYGNTVIIDHGFGLTTIYGHCTDIFVDIGDSIKANSVIATTGTTGLALGDHLHFEIRVGEVPVTPIEWMDKNWIKNNITKVMDDAKSVIEGRDI